MKQNDCYVLKRIAGVPYLLPVGQMIGDFKRSIRINETGVYLWKLLEKDRTLEELIRLCASHYSIKEETLPQLGNDVAEFVSSLTAQDILVPSHTVTDTKSPFYKCIEIAGLRCKLYGPKEAFSQSFEPFFCEPCADCIQNIEVLYHLPETLENGRLLLRNHELSIIERGDKYILLFPAACQILEAHLTKSGSLARFYCLPPVTDNLRSDLFHAIRLVWLYLAQLHNMAALHSASVLYRGRAWLFSGSSGTGKSTHTNLWSSLYNVPIINGDLNLLAMENGHAVVHGIPWCGTSGIFDTHTYPLGGIILLRQADGDYVENLPDAEKRLLVLQRLISPSWTKALLNRNLALINSLAQDIMICRLCCTPRNIAAETAKRQIDSFLDA